MNLVFPCNETARLHTLHQLGLLDTAPTPTYDDLTHLAAQMCQTPLAALNLVDANRQWSKSIVGLTIKESAREHSLCARAILHPDSVLVVPDMRLDERFSSNPSVIGEPHLRFYAGAPLVTEEGLALGALCVMDVVPRQLSDIQIASLQALSRQVVSQFALHQLRSRAQQLEHQLVHDELTGLHNRRAFNRTLKQEMSHTQSENSPLSLILLDVDRFKNYNDYYGHLAGDEILSQIGQVLFAQAKNGIMAARYGGEEFALLLPNTTQEQAVAVAQSIRCTFEQRKWAGRVVTASFGVATTTSHLNTEETLVAAADVALYASKENGRNCVNHYATLT